MPFLKDEKIYRKSGNVGFPEEETLEIASIHDGKRKRKTAQLTIIHHNSGVKYRLAIKEFESNNGVFKETSHIPLNEDATDKLFRYLLSREQFAEIAQTTMYTVVENFGPLDKSSIEQLGKLILRATKNKQVKSIVPSDVISNFTAVLHQIRYKDALQQLEQMLKEKHSEKEYENWFMENHWVFGTEYLNTEKAKIGWRTEGDIILTSTDGYQDVIELKLPEADVLKYDDSHKNWYPSPDLSKAISQAIKYLQESEDVRLTIESKEKLPFLKPRAKVVIGRSNQWNQEQLDCLRKLNCELHNIQVMTYDHLLSSANRMIQYYEEEEKETAEQLSK